jgi:hypothetical protein
MSPTAAQLSSSMANLHVLRNSMAAATAEGRRMSQNVQTAANWSVTLGVLIVILGIAALRADPDGVARDRV